MALAVLFCAACCLPQRVPSQVISAAVLLPDSGGQPAPVDMGQRFVVMRCLQAMCESGQLLVDLFVNYDCDLEGANLFERMVLALVRLAQSSTPADAPAQTHVDEAGVRIMVGLGCGFLSMLFAVGAAVRTLSARC